MNIDIVLRGDIRNFLPHTIKNFMRMVVDPFKENGHNTRIFTTMWYDEGDDSVQREIIGLLKPTDHKLLNKTKYYNHIGYTQWDVFLMGMDMVEQTQSEDYQTDITLFLRFDILWKQPIINWVKLDDPSWDVMVPWKEYENWWLHHNRVSDVFHIIRNKEGNFDKFREALHSKSEFNVIYRVLYQLDIPNFLTNWDESYKKLSLESGTHEVFQVGSDNFYGYWMAYKGHHLYKPMVRCGLNVTFSDEGFYDSNTYHTRSTKMTPTINKNPIYILVYPDVENCLYYHDDVKVSELVEYDVQW